MIWVRENTRFIVVGVGGGVVGVVMSRERRLLILCVFGIWPSVREPSFWCDGRGVRHGRVVGWAEIVAIAIVLVMVEFLLFG